MNKPEREKNTVAFLAGIDGGGTKTLCLIGDEKGRVLSKGLSGGSNYQSVGKEAAHAAIQEALGKALAPLGMTCGELNFVVFGLAGADTERDYNILIPLCREICKHEQFMVVNDARLGLRAGTENNRGIVTVCGTGGACFGRNRYGVEISLRNLGYGMGNRGGGYEIALHALHHAFRSEEGTGKKTRLEQDIPGLFGLPDMNGLLDILYTGSLTSNIVTQLPVLVCRLACEGDEICQDILIDIGRAQGQIACGVVRRLKMQDERFDAVLVGGVFKSENPLLKDAYTGELHRTAPCARISVLLEEPAVGAYRLALDCFMGNNAK